LNYCSVIAVLEKATSIFGAESRDRCAYRFEQGLSATSLGFTHQALYLAESLFNGVKVW